MKAVYFFQTSDASYTVYLLTMSSLFLLQDHLLCTRMRIFFIHQIRPQSHLSYMRWAYFCYLLLFHILFNALSTFCFVMFECLNEQLHVAFPRKSVLDAYQRLKESLDWSIARYSFINSSLAVWLMKAFTLLIVWRCSFMRLWNQATKRLLCCLRTSHCTLQPFVSRIVSFVGYALLINSRCSQAWFCVHFDHFDRGTSLFMALYALIRPK